MRHMRTIAPDDFDHSREIDEHTSLVAHPVDSLGAVSSAESPIEPSPAAGRLIRGLIVDAVLNADGGIREFRIGETRSIE